MNPTNPLSAANSAPASRPETPEEARSSSGTPYETSELSRLLAEDACTVFWWAFRLRMPRAQQLEEVEKALAKRLAEARP